MKIFKSLDFKSQVTRIEKNNPGKYLVHLEDYESLNDLIRRSIRTKSRFVLETSKNAVYDDVLDEFDDEFQQKINRNQQQQVKPEETVPVDEQSEVNGISSSSGEQVLVGLP